MKRLFLGLLAAAFVAFGAGSQASASTINVNPNPTDSFAVFGSSPSAGLIDDPYVFVLSHAADLTDSILVSNVSGLTLTLFDGVTPVSLSSDLLAGITYTLHISATALAGGGFYGGHINFSAVPVPPALLLFATALVGLGAAGYRRRSTSSAA